MLIKLKSGRAIEANRGLLSLDYDLQLFEGYDSPLYFADRDEEALTNREKREIATLMITRWNDWCEQA